MRAEAGTRSSLRIVGLEASRAPIGVAGVEISLESGTAQVLAVDEAPDARALSSRLLESLDRVLEHTGWNLDSVGALAVGLGPGSWTGLRVTLSVVKTLAQVREIPLVGVPSFDALAQAAWRASEREEPQIVIVTASCRPGELYGKIFEAHPEALLPAQADWIASPRDLVGAALAQALSRGIDAPLGIVAAEGEGALELLAQAAAEDGAEVEAVSVDIAAATIEVAIAAAEKLAGGEEDDPLLLQPIYVALSAAERNLLSR
jgi:tRNA threonylcarbamoyladenosine biosynthesis protein TsaB